MNSHVAYWLFLIIVFLVSLFLIIKKGLKIIDFIMLLTVFGAASFGNEIIATHYKLFIYYNENLNSLYSAIYDGLVYPSCGLWFSFYYPKIIETKKIIYYSLKWIIFLLFVEYFIIYQFGIIKYTGWKIIPHSLIFYIICIPLTSVYYILILKWVHKALEITHLNKLK